MVTPFWYSEMRATEPKRHRASLCTAVLKWSSLPWLAAPPMPAGVSSNAVVRFGVFEADLRSGELHKCGVKVKIQELPFQALKLLLSHPNEILSPGGNSPDPLAGHSGVYVDFDRGVISAINRLRDSLGDSAENPVFIETVGRRGYRWIAPTHFSEPPSELAFDPEPQAVAAPASTPRWKFILLLPVLALVVVVWIYWPRHASSNDRSSSGRSVPMSATATVSSPSFPPEPASLIIPPIAKPRSSTSKAVTIGRSEQLIA